jgi:hypothetical protein
VANQLLRHFKEFHRDVLDTSKRPRGSRPCRRKHVVNCTLTTKKSKVYGGVSGEEVPKGNIVQVVDVSDFNYSANHF